MLGVYNSPLVDDSGFYVPFYGTVEGPVPPAPAPAGFATVVVRPRASVRAETMVSALRRAVEKVDRDLPLYYVGTPAQHYDNALAQSRVIAGMFSIFGLRGRADGLGRPLRRDVLLGEPASPGVWRAHGTRRRSPRDRGHGAAPRRPPDRARPDAWLRRWRSCSRRLAGTSWPGCCSTSAHTIRSATRSSSASSPSFRSSPPWCQPSRAARVDPMTALRAD